MYSSPDERGLGHWMERVLEDRRRVRKGFDFDALHDLRTSLRRCRTMAAELRAIDGHPDWWLLNRRARRLFQRVGKLRDLQVMRGWAEQFLAADPTAYDRLVDEINRREIDATKIATEALDAFKPKKWRALAATLAPRSVDLLAEHDVWRSVALRRWEEARRLHDLAERTGNYPHYHELRIGLKRFRYVTENFLPEFHGRHAAGLKRVQELLGNVQDVHVLLGVIAEVFPDETDRARVAWERRLDEEVRTWIAWYQAETRRGIDAAESTGSEAAGCWESWRAGLPAPGEELERSAALHAAMWLARWMARFDENQEARDVAALAAGRRPRSAKPGSRKKKKKQKSADVEAVSEAGSAAPGGLGGEGAPTGWIIDRSDPATVTRLLHEARGASRGRVQRAYAEAFLVRGVETDQEHAWGRMALAAKFDRQRAAEPACSDLRHLRTHEGKAIRDLRLAAGL